MKNRLNSIQSAYLQQGLRPNENSFGASGSQAMPDSSARPAGLGRFSYTDSILYPLESVLKAVFGIPNRIPMI
jgi:hypothetical protein